MRQIMSNVKAKTKSAVKKRVKITATGKIVRGKAFTSHLAKSKTQKQKRHARKLGVAAKADSKKLKLMLNI